MKDAKEPYGSVLDKALGALSEDNESLQHVLDHISFMRTQGNKRVVSDEACKELVRHFSTYRELTTAFVDELKTRCAAMDNDERQALVLELFAQDVQIGLDAAVNEKRQALVRLVEELQDKYWITLKELREDRQKLEKQLIAHMQSP